MQLYIKIQNGRPYEHPILEDNFKQAFPNIDTSKLPSNFAKFERVPAPVYGVYEVLSGPTYQWVNGVVKDVWQVRPMTPDEKLDKQLAVKQHWVEHGFASWTFDEETCSFKPPIPRPQDGQQYRWNETNKTWELVSQE